MGDFCFFCHIQSPTKLILYAKTRNARILLPLTGKKKYMQNATKTKKLLIYWYLKTLRLQMQSRKGKLCVYALFTNFSSIVNWMMASFQFIHLMDVRPSDLCTYVHTPLGRTSIHPLNVRPHTLGRTSIEKLWDKMGKHDPKSPFSRLLRIAYLPTRKFPVDFTAFSEAIEIAKSYGLLPMCVNMSRACSPTLLLNMS